MISLCIMLFPSTVRYPLRAVWDVKGYPTETLLWPAKNNTNKTVLFFIPGNPGLVEYYAPFLDNIYQNLQSPLLEIIGGNCRMSNYLKAYSVA